MNEGPKPNALNHTADGNATALHSLQLMLTCKNVSYGGTPRPLSPIGLGLACGEGHCVQGAQTIPIRLRRLKIGQLLTEQQPCREIAVTAFRAMLERIADPMIPPRSIALSPRLVIRESCGAYMDSAKENG